jgi:hypothetical protein
MEILSVSRIIEMRQKLRTEKTSIIFKNGTFVLIETVANKCKFDPFDQTQYIPSSIKVGQIVKSVVHKRHHDSSTETVELTLTNNSKEYIVINTYNCVKKPFICV